MGTSVNLRLVIREIKNILRIHKKDIIFIDFSNAYNSVIREKLFQIMKE